MAGGGEGVSTDKSADFGVIVAGLEVVELRLFVIDIATVAQGVEGAYGRGQGAGDGEVVALVNLRIATPVWPPVPNDNVL